MRRTLLGGLRRLMQPFLLKYWYARRLSSPTRTHVSGLRLEVHPTVFHPKYFGSSRILADYVSGLPIVGRRLLDMGTGTGVVGLGAARAGAVVTAVDINPAAVACARGNAALNGITMEVLQSDLFDALSGRRFDLIVWNPPFFPEEPVDMAGCGWYAGAGFRAIARFAGSLRDHLDPGSPAYIILTEDTSIREIAPLFEQNGLRMTGAEARCWGLGETMTVFEVR